MSIADIELHLKKALELLDGLKPAAVATFTAPPGTLGSVLTAAPAGATIVVEGEQALDGHVFTKPVYLKGALGGCTIRGAGLVAQAPDVVFDGISIASTRRDATILTTGLRTKIYTTLLRGSSQGQHRGIAVNSADVEILATDILNIWHSIDTQAIAGWKGTKNLLVEDCILEASGENIIFGGDDCAESEIPDGITIKSCNLTKPTTWKGKAGCTVKNLFELKNARNVVFEGNTCGPVWKNGQDGYAVVLTVRNQYGGAPWSTIENVSLRNNYFVGMGAGINILGRDDSYPSRVMKNVQIYQNTFEDINAQVWGGAARQVMIQGGPQDLRLAGNTFKGSGYQNSFFTFGQPQHKLNSLAVEGNEFMEGEYGIHGEAALGLGKAAVDFYNPNGYQWSGNTVRRGPSGRAIVYPAGTTLV